ncbi:MAG TPA: HAD-IA family hydrolase [Halomicronema sp.]
MLKAVLFDLDGTLANTDPIHFLTWQGFLRDYGLEIDDEFYKSKISGRLNHLIVRDILPQLSGEEGDRVAEEKEAYFRRIAGDLEAISGLGDLLQWVEDKSLKLALVTNAPRANAEFMLDVLKVADKFEEVILASELPMGKPDPAPYLLALKRLGISASEAIAFEDSPSGIRSAADAGIFTVGVTSSHEPALLIEVGASLTIEDFTDLQLWKMLESINF